MSNLQLLPEVWMPIKNYEGLYEISNHGRVRKMPRQLKSPRFKGAYTDIKIMKCEPLVDKYRRINLYTFKKSKQYKRHQIHRLVAAHFICDIPDGYEVNHIDLNTANNYVGNLEIVTPLENTHHSLRLQGNKAKIACAIKIKATHIVTKEEIIYPSMIEMTRLIKISYNTIKVYLNNSNKAYKGYTFTKIAS